MAKKKLYLPFRLLYQHDVGITFVNLNKVVLGQVVEMQVKENVT